MLLERINMQIAKEDIYNIFRGEAILFLGAGFSMENKNPRGQRLPSASKLSRELQIAAGISSQEVSDNASLEDVSQYFIEQVGKTQLVKLLKETFTVSNVLEWQKKLLELPWLRIYTTNYDNVLELSSTLAGKHRRPIAVGSTTEKVQNLEDAIIHINGFVDNITEDNLQNSTKLTSESYADTYFINSPWNTELSHSFKYAKNVFFVGFSAKSDLDLKRIIASQEQIRNKVYFINGEVSDINKVSLKKFGKVTNYTGQSFAELVIEEKEGYVPIDVDKEPRTYSFLPSCLSVNTAKVNGSDISDLLISGKINNNKLFSNYDSSNYIVYREKLNMILSNIEKLDLFIVLSYLGNGKTIFLKILESELLKKGYRVFTYSKNSDSIYSDINALNKIQHDKCCIIIDDYYSIKSEFSLLQSLDNKKFKIVVSGRRTLHGNNIRHFKEAIGIKDSQSYTVYLDMLTKGEQISLQKIIEEHNIWGQLASKTDEEKLEFIKKNSERGISGFIVEFLRKTNILKKFVKIYTEFELPEKEIVMLLLINNILSIGLNVQDILKLTNNIYISDKILLNPNLGEFLDVEKDEIIFKSSAASIELLNEEKDRRSLVRLLSKVLLKAGELDYDDTYLYLKRAIISFSNFKLLNREVSTEELNRLAVEYYETIQNYKFTKENQFFWLQFGIQRLEEKNYILADKYFDNALNYASSKGMKDFYQINAQKARGIVENIVENGVNIEEAFSQMLFAHSLLVKDLNNFRNNQSYQLSQGKLYLKFYNKYGEKLTASDTYIKFKMIVMQYKREIEKYLNQNGKVSIVTESLADIEKILQSKEQ